MEKGNDFFFFPSTGGFKSVVFWAVLEVNDSPSVGMVTRGERVITKDEHWTLLVLWDWQEHTTETADWSGDPRFWQTVTWWMSDHGRISPTASLRLTMSFINTFLANTFPISSYWVHGYRRKQENAFVGIQSCESLLAWISYQISHYEV